MMFCLKRSLVHFGNEFLNKDHSVHKGGTKRPNSKEEDAVKSRLPLEKNAKEMYRHFYELLGDGASWLTVVEEGELVDTVGSGATTLAIGAMTLGAGRSTLDGGLNNSSNSGLNKRCHSVLEGGTNSIEGVGFGTSPELIVAGVIS
ncbi:hypothetical protein Tco_0159248 [Tanacetum coccineum]